ncbi:darcynin family protein [Streptomyces sp. NPDC047315]|uniref:Uncharacterized protein ravV n=1 Tax=Streptomyces ravidus TaxID=691266 RepID=D1H0K7_9ACTN|nr:hypothetical protein [Streptomyces ravidus]
MKYTAFLGVRFEPEWFLLEPAERDRFEAENVFPILGKHAATLDIRPFRASGFSTRHTDFFLVGFDDVAQYHAFVEDLRESPLAARRYVTVTDNAIGIEQPFGADDSA